MIYFFAVSFKWKCSVYWLSMENDYILYVTLKYNKLFFIFSFLNLVL